MNSQKLKLTVSKLHWADQVPQSRKLLGLEESKVYDLDVLLYYVPEETAICGPLC